MPHHHATTATLTALALAAGLGLGACTGDDGEGASRACTPGESRVGSVLVDDQAVLPAGNWVPVVSTREGFRERLEALDAVTRAVSGEDLAVVRAAEGPERAEAARVAVAEVARARGGAGQVRLVTADAPDAAAVAALWSAGLSRQGARVVVAPSAAVADVLDPLAADAEERADVALVPLADLAAEVGAELPEDGDPSAQVQAVATAALEQDLALGATSAATTTPQVLVASDVVADGSLATLGDLAEACGGATIAATEGAEDAAGALAEAYGFELASEPVASAEEAFAGEGDVVAVVTG